MTIREANQGDVSALARLSTELGYPATASQVQRRLQHVMHAEGHCVMVACPDQDHVQGWIHVFIAPRLESDSFGELGGLVVAEDVRGQGIGKSLVDAAETWVRKQGLYSVRVRTRTDREGAHAFYEKLGFTESKVQRVYSKVLSQTQE